MRQLVSVAEKDLAVCDAVLTEAGFHLPHESQRQRLRALLERLGVRAVPTEYEPGFWREVFDWLAKYADHEPAWADACLAWKARADSWRWPWNWSRATPSKTGSPPAPGPSPRSAP